MVNSGHSWIFLINLAAIQEDIDGSAHISTKCWLFPQNAVKSANVSYYVFCRSAESTNSHRTQVKV